MAEKALLSSIFGKLTQKTLAMSYKQVIGKEYHGKETPGFLLCNHGYHSTLVLSPVNGVSIADFRVLRKRLKPFESLIQLRLNA